MTTTTTTPKKVNYEDFLKIYPPLTEKVDPATYKTFNKYFKKKEKKVEKNEEEKIEKNDKKTKKRRRATISNERDIEIVQQKEILKDEEEEWYLVNKGIDLQNKKRKRTHDIKNALGSFFNQSDLIAKLIKYFQQFDSELLTTPETPKHKHGHHHKDKDKDKENERDSTSVLPLLSSIIKNKEIEEKIFYKIQGITSKLTDSVKILKFKQNKYVIKMNEIGEQCYFLLSGRLSVLKPVEYKNMKISYEDYFRYLMKLYHYGEYELIEQLIQINRKFVNIHCLDNLLLFVKSYFMVKLNKDIIKSEIEINIHDIEKKFEDFYFTFEDFDLKRKDILYQIAQIEYNNKNNPSPNKKNLITQVNNYLLSVFKPSFEQIFVMDKCKFLFDPKAEKESQGCSLFKYEIFICLFPGAFFGETALENASKKRNASIRTEEECIILSLSNEIYGSLLIDDSKKLKSLDVSFIVNNFFFENISPVLFNKYYFPFFKAITKKKNELLYHQGEEMTSVFLLREGEIKSEIFCSVLDVYNIIKSFVYCIEKNNHLFRLSEREVKNIKDAYLNDTFYFSLRNKNDAFNDQLKQKKKMLIYICNTYESIGIIEYFMETKYISSCYVNSLSAKLMEISKNDLEKIIGSEKIILSSYYQTVCNKILSQIKRLHELKEDYIKQFEHKIKEKIYDENINRNYFIKGQVGNSKPYIREKITIKPLLYDNSNNYNHSNMRASNLPSDILKKKNYENQSKILNKKLSFILNDNNIPFLNNNKKIMNNKGYNSLKKNGIVEHDNEKFMKNNYNSNYKYNSSENSLSKKSIKVIKEENKIPNLFLKNLNDTSISKTNPKKFGSISNTIVNCGRKFLSLRQIKQKLRNLSQDTYEFNKIRTEEENSLKRDDNKNKQTFYKNDFGLSQTNFRYDLLNVGKKLKISSDIMKSYPSSFSFGINSNKYGINTSPTFSDRVSFWKNKQINNFEEIKKFNPRKKLMHTMFIQPIESKRKGKTTIINNPKFYNNTFLLSQKRDIRDF